MTGSAPANSGRQDEFAMARSKLVVQLRDEFGLSDEKVLEAIGTVPRHRFVPEALKFQAYRNNALPIRSGQTISQPLIVARMTSLLELSPSSKVLEIGTGTGYQTAVLAALADRVYSIERLPDLAESAQAKLNELGIKNVTVKCGDGTKGWEAYSPYDRILVTAGSPIAPEPLIEQLAVNGMLVIPVGDEPRKQELVRITKAATGLKRERLGGCAFVPLIGEHGWSE